MFSLLFNILGFWLCLQDGVVNCSVFEANIR